MRRQQNPQRLASAWRMIVDCFSLLIGFLMLLMGQGGGELAWHGGHDQPAPPQKQGPGLGLVLLEAGQVIVRGDKGRTPLSPVAVERVVKERKPASGPFTVKVYFPPRAACSSMNEVAEAVSRAGGHPEVLMYVSLNDVLKEESHVSAR